jgi:AraC family transcriptional regulator of adaptative response / DNA-3-methyladenine glycosylase II
MKREDVFYQALRSRDHSFDGKFFVGVKTTGIYCRPICPAKPKRENVEFFSSALAAERAGYRPCRRCRPEAAPLSPAWVGKSAVVARALKALHAPEAIVFDEDGFAARFGVTARHLRRLFTQEIGKTPKRIAFENRLNLARRLVAETGIPMAEVAFASGFSSIRRFNDAFKERFKCPPGRVRRGRGLAAGAGLTVSLPYRPPFDFEGLRRTYERHRVGKLEWFTDDGRMHRLIEAAGGRIGHIMIGDDPERSRLKVEMDLPDTTVIHSVLTRVRRLFDLDADPVLVANRLETDVGLAKLLRGFPGIRLPSGWDPFEIAVATILGQMVSVERGRALVEDLMEIAGREASFQGRMVKLFPTPREILTADLGGLKTTAARKRTLLEFAGAIIEGRLSLEPTQDVDEFLRRVQAVKGIGPWTAHYMALKALRHADGFPAGDLILARALVRHPLVVIDRMSPWRGYVAALLWRSYGGSPRKE